LFPLHWSPFCAQAGTQVPLKQLPLQHDAGDAHD
jgi:hypothetical protein